MTGDAEFEGWSDDELIREWHRLLERFPPRTDPLPHDAVEWVMPPEEAEASKRMRRIGDELRRRGIDGY